MCGINGFVNFAATAKEENHICVSRMNSCIECRGPDDEGVFADEHLAIGMRRLAIIDLSTGNQPIFNEDNSLAIVFNGEIYNFIELRDKLIRKGHCFKTQGDTETILHAYEEYGIECLKEINGMFAFAIYDFNRKQLFIARDRAGEKPLYFFKDSSRFAFASELKSILAAFEIRKRINVTALNQYLALTYIPAPLTIFEGIYKLEAGCYLLFKDSEISINRYWDVDLSENSTIDNYEESKKLLRASLIDSVEKKMISDVPLGAFLSGGIDSSIIVGIMAMLSSKPVETFTIGFRNKEYDESDRAQIVASCNETNHHVHYLDYNDAIEYLDHILGVFDEPFADSSAIPTFFVSKYARQHVKVVLTGDAGDELFAGYSKYMINYYSDLYKKVPSLLRKQVLEKVIYGLPDKTAFTRKAKKVISNAYLDTFCKRRNLMLLGVRDRENLLAPTYYDSSGIDFIKEVYEKFSSVDELTKTLYTDFRVVLEGDMLVKVDRMSMLNSIETRVPLLDPRVIELAFNMPSEYKIKGRSQKHILKDTFSDLLPEGIQRKSKRGFAVPIGEWFKGALKHELLSVLAKDFIEEQGLFDYAYISKLLEDHMSEKSNNYSQLWTLFVFQKWYMRYYK